MSDRKDVGLIEPKKALLIQVERHIADGRALIAQQRKMLMSLALSGADISKAVSVLRTLLESQRLHEQHHQQLLIELARKKKDKARRPKPTPKKKAPLQDARG